MKSPEVTLSFWRGYNYKYKPYSINNNNNNHFTVFVSMLDDRPGIVMILYLISRPSTCQHGPYLSSTHWWHPCVFLCQLWHPTDQSLGVNIYKIYWWAADHCWWCCSMNDEAIICVHGSVPTFSFSFYFFLFVFPNDNESWHGKFGVLSWENPTVAEPGYELG